MKLTSRHTFGALLAIGAFACLSLALHLMYAAGCTGDIKGGGAGDIPRALEIESDAVGFAWGGILLAALIAIAVPRMTILQRGIAALVIALSSFALFTYFGVAAEVRGVQSCLSDK